MTDINYDESKVPQYTLPNPLALEDGRIIQDVTEWTSQQRPRLLNIFEKQVYGQVPPLPQSIVEATLLAEDTVFDGLGIRKQFTVPLLDQESSPTMTILLYLPTKMTKPADIFLGLNFNGNHAIDSDEGILISDGWLAHNDSNELERGASSGRWSIQRILSRGYGLATIYHGDISTDLREGYGNNIYSYFYKDGQTEPESNEWGAIGAWAWGLRRAIDYFTQHETSVNRIMLIGHSRLGKAALWASVQDERCVLVISNNSGCMGAALSRRAFGETVEALNTNWSRWVCRDFHQYSRKESDLPIDQHTLISLIAPRPVYIASAEDDLWADPYGEFLGGYHANPAYHLYGKQGLPVDEHPAIHQPVMGTIGYHIRAGEHNVTDYEWQCFLDFADQHMIE
jgi:hypothetical protein